ncbi:MAG: PIN domain-containing protein [Candidatus Bathyarchaeota archaeon]|jgi:predicted nucleic acid-binding protein|nr:PIN domain-containing protein [Candidatus Bathyarchaeota archaeon]
MDSASRLLTLDSNVLIAALKEDEPYSEKCVRILNNVPDNFVLAEPSIIYQEVCGTLARKVGIEIAEHASKQLDLIIHPRLLTQCTKAFCTSAYPLCAEYDIYAIDAIYLKVAIDRNAILVSLDKEDFIDKIKTRNPPIEAYHVTEFPY